MQRFITLLVSSLCLSFFALSVNGQTEEPFKFEVGGHFTTITKPSFNNGDTEPGFGGRFTYNINRTFAIEAVGNFFPHSCQFCGGFNGDNGGNITQGLVGVKIGKRFEKWGIFGKARPGVVSFSKGDNRFVLTPPGSAFPVEIQRNRLTNFAFDIGGILEFYPTKRLVTRFEAGDTLIHYHSRPVNGLAIDPVTGVITLIPFNIPSDTRHNFQFVAGIGWRF